MCRVYTSEFNVKEELILALDIITTDIPPSGGCCNSEKKGDYELSHCGVFHVRASDVEAMEAAENCVMGVTIVPDLDNTNATGEIVSCDLSNLSFYPNPTVGITHMDIAGVAFGDSEFSMPRRASAFGIRLLTELIESYTQE